jgi:hypothetical protein
MSTFVMDVFGLRGNNPCEAEFYVLEIKYIYLYCVVI